MKKYLLILLIATAGFSCKKNDKPQAEIPSFSLTQEILNIYVGETKTLSIIDGSGSFEVTSNTKEVVTVTMDGTSSFAVKCLQKGNAVITIKDTKSGKTQTVTVVATIKIFPLELSQESASLIIGASQKITIISGNNSYEITSANEQVAKATLNERSITIVAIKEGETVITIKDTKSGNTKTIKTIVSLFSSKITTDDMPVVPWQPDLP